MADFRTGLEKVKDEPVTNIFCQKVRLCSQNMIRAYCKDTEVSLRGFLLTKSEIT